MKNSWSVGIETISNDYQKQFTQKMKDEFNKSLQKTQKKVKPAEDKSKQIKGVSDKTKDAKPIAFEMGKADIKTMNNDIVQITQFIGQRLQETTLAEYKENFQRHYGDNVILGSISDALAFGSDGSPFYAVDGKKIQFEAKPGDIQDFNSFKAKESRDVWGINRVNYEFDDYTPGQYDSGFKDYSAKRNSESFSLHNRIWRDGGFTPVDKVIKQTNKFVDDDFGKEYKNSIKQFVKNKTGILLG